MFPLNLIQTHEPPLRAMALRALGYCPRLFCAPREGGERNLSGYPLRAEDG
jgi:hypothetical protein